MYEFSHFYPSSSPPHPTELLSGAWFTAGINSQQLIDEFFFQIQFSLQMSLNMLLRNKALSRLHERERMSEMHVKNVQRDLSHLKLCSNM